MPPIGYSMLSRTKDSESKAWRKKQIVYKISRRQGAVEAITDIIVCTKTKLAPHGFLSAGEINGTLICYKISNVAHRPSPSIPKSPLIQSTSDNLGNAMTNLNINLTKSLYPNSPDYENLKSPSNNGISPKRPAPKPPTTNNGTLGSTNSDVDGIPFVLNPALNNNSAHFEVSN